MSTTAEPVASPPAAGRLPALDWLRGLVMALMAVDHADAVLNPNHQSVDGVMMGPSPELTVQDFLTRWCTHLCAPSFVFLAGAGMALSATRRRGAGIDRHLLIRAAVLIALEVTLMSFYWRQQMPELGVTLQVLYAIAGGMAAMVVLRRLPAPALVVLALALPLLCEWALQTIGPRGGAQSLPARLLVTGGFDTWPPGLFVIYPVLPWLPPMLLGWAFGCWLARNPGRSPRLRLRSWGAAAIIAFGLLRGWNGFGNMLLGRRDGSLLEWLHCSKYPPSATFLFMELGLMALLLVGLFRLQRAVQRPWEWNPLLVIGQVPLFFYLVHLPVLVVWIRLGVFGDGGHAGWSWVAALVTTASLYPVCGLYRWYKQTLRHPWTRYL